MSLARHLHTPLRVLRGSQPCSVQSLACQASSARARSFSQTAVRRAEDGEDSLEERREGSGGGRGRLGMRGGAFRGPNNAIYADPLFDAWKRGAGSRFRNVSDGKNYLGGDRPFPLNPSFTPPVPLSDELRSKIYLAYMRDGMGIRELSQKYHVSLRRVEALLRLKHLELEWVQGRPLETKFRDGMEEALGVKAKARSNNSEDTNPNTELADFLGDILQSYPLDGKSVKLYWEPVADGDTPILDTMTAKKHQRQLALADAQKREYPVKLVPRREGKVFYQFTDVGDLYVEPAVLADRAKRGVRRREMRVKREKIRADEMRRARSVEVAST